MTDESQVMKNRFQKPPVIAYRRHKNLRDILVRAKLPPKRGPKRTLKGFKGCGELCKLCTFSPNGTTKHHTCKQNGTTYEINSPMNCKTSGVIYKITCKKCPTFVYIGETGRPIKQRFMEHYRDARNEDVSKPCGKHFSQKGHSEADMSLIAIEQVLPKNDTLLRKRRDMYWINLYQSVISDGNVKSS